jgi:hypothetical protein
MEIWLQSIARAGGVELPPGVRIMPPATPKAPRRPGVGRRLSAAATAAAGAGLHRLGRTLERIGDRIAAGAQLAAAPCDQAS